MKKRGENEIKVFISLQDSICSDCNEQLGHKAWITLQREKGALCLSCADLDHLVFLLSGVIPSIWNIAVPPYVAMLAQKDFNSSTDALHTPLM